MHPAIPPAEPGEPRPLPTEHPRFLLSHCPGKERRLKLPHSGVQLPRAGREGPVGTGTAS